VKVEEAKSLVLDLMSVDLATSQAPVVLDPVSPDPRDLGKFVIGGRVARVIHHWSGWHPLINLGWFSGGYDEPEVHGSPFYWYVFALPRGNRYQRDHYFICDYLQMRTWVLDFTAPLGNDHRDHRDWRADIRIYPDEREGYFRWGDEPITFDKDTERVIALDNVETVSELGRIKQRVGTFGQGGESAAHRRLKLYVAAHPTEFGLSAAAQPFVEHRFQTGDRVDVMFENHLPDRTVVEVEIAGEDNICVGIHQAIKYRSLAEAEAGYQLHSSRVRSLVVAYDTDYGRAAKLGERYEVALQSVDRELVLSTAG
jgi:hypothetical protein